MMFQNLQGWMYLDRGEPSLKFMHSSSVDYVSFSPVLHCVCLSQHGIADDNFDVFHRTYSFNLLTSLLLRGPYYLGVYDLANIRDSGAIFIRKVTKAIDPNLLHLLPVNSRDQIPHIQWPKEVNITDKPDWGRFQHILVNKKRGPNK